jgi:hypothetical protein
MAGQSKRSGTPSGDSPKGTPSTSARQREQQELVTRARQIPGVAEAMDVYGRVDAHNRAWEGLPSVRYASGANS